MFLVFVYVDYDDKQKKMKYKQTFDLSHLSHILITQNHLILAYKQNCMFLTHIPCHFLLDGHSDQGGLLTKLYIEIIPQLFFCNLFSPLDHEMSVRI